MLKHFGMLRTTGAILDTAIHQPLLLARCRFHKPSEQQIISRPRGKEAHVFVNFPSRLFIFVFTIITVIIFYLYSDVNRVRLIGRVLQDMIILQNGFHSFRLVTTERTPLTDIPIG